MNALPSLSYDASAPLPCDTCSRRSCCRVQCVAFVRYVGGLPWRADDRPPQVEITMATNWGSGTKRCTRCNQRKSQTGGTGGKFVCADCIAAIKRERDEAQRRGER